MGGQKVLYDWEHGVGDDTRIGHLLDVKKLSAYDVRCYI